jgi:hypothetical protein
VVGSGHFLGRDSGVLHQALAALYVTKASLIHESAVLRIKRGGGRFFFRGRGAERSACLDEGADHLLEFFSKSKKPTSFS